MPILKILSLTLALTVAMPLTAPSFACAAESPASTTTVNRTTAAQTAHRAVAAARPKIVILVASLGFGHISAGNAVIAAMEEKYPGADIVLKDVLDFKGALEKKVVQKGYDLSVKMMPSMYDKWFKKYMKTGETIPSIGQMSEGKKYKPEQILAYLEREQPTLIVSAFMHATEALIFLRDQSLVKDIPIMHVPIAQVLTDYVDAPYFERLGERIEMSFVPHEAIREKWIADGFPAANVITAGMPVQPALTVPLNLADKVRFYDANGLKTDERTVLLVSGSAGVGDYNQIVRSIAAANPAGKPLQIIAVAGKSEENLAAIRKLSANPPNGVVIRPFGLMPQADLFTCMKSVDVIVTKTGGLSISEIAAVGVPLVALDINGGQENYNADFFAKHGMALATNDQSKVGALVQHELNDADLRAKMITSQHELRDMNDPSKIANWILKEEGIDLAALPAVLPRAELQSSRALFLNQEREVGIARLSLVKKENREISALYYMVDGKRVGAVALAEYWAAAKRGKRVRLVVDGFAPAQWLDSSLDPGMLAAMIEDGVEIRIFNPVSAENRLAVINPNTYRRTHDKMTIYKGLGILQIGDRNMQNINFRMMKGSDKSYRSVEAYVQGPVMKDAQKYFDLVWASPLTKDPDLKGVTQMDIDRGRQALAGYIRAMDNSEIGKAARAFDVTAKMTPVEKVEFFHDIPGQKGLAPGSSEKVIELIGRAKHELRIISPYIVLTEKERDALYKAMKNGVKLTIITAGAHATDVPISSMALEEQAPGLIARGAKVYFHQGPDILHAKFMEIDGVTDVTLTHNLDGVSEIVNLESGVVLTGAPEFVADGAKFIDSMISESLPYAKTPKPFYMTLAAKCAAWMTLHVDSIPNFAR